MSVRYAAIALLLTTTACEEALQPFDPQHENLHYSMWGYLDASADTQWIRISPVRESILTEPGELDATVTLEHLGSGETYVMNDSVFRFESPERITGVEDAEDAVVHNYWTDAPIEFEETYRLSVTGPGGMRTTATVRIPDDIERIEVNMGGLDGTARIFGIEHLGIVVKRVHLIDDPDRCLPGYPHLWLRNKPFRGLEPGTWLANEIAARERGSYPCPVADQDLLVVASGVEWIPDGIEFSTQAPTEFGFPSSVEDGLGHVAGVVSRVVPLEECFTEDVVGLLRVCTLTYLDGLTGSLQGTITASACGGVPAAGVAVLLREIAEDPSQRVLIRRDETDPDGFYRIDAIQADKTYELRVQTVPIDTLRFGPDEHQTRDIAFDGFAFCEYPS